MKEVAHELINHATIIIIIRKADKSNILVVLYKNEYLKELQLILDDRKTFNKMD